MNESNRGKLTFGLAMLLTGVLLFLQLDPSTGAGFGMLWPLYLVLFGFMGMLNRNGKAFSLILFIIGLYFLFRNLDVLPYIPSMYIWPSIIILIALVAIFSAFAGKKYHSVTADGEKYSAFFGETKEVIKDRDIKSLSVWVMFGNVELDLSQARIQDGSAVIDIFSMFGGAEIIVPDDCAVEMKITPILGGVENKTRAEGQEKKLLLSGTVILGGAAIRSR